MTEKIKFGTDGWRAIIADQFTFENVERVAYAVGMHIKKEYGLADKNSSQKKPILMIRHTVFWRTNSLNAQVKSCQHGPFSPHDRTRCATPCIAFAAQNESTAELCKLPPVIIHQNTAASNYIPHFGGPATNDITTTSPNISMTFRKTTSLPR